MAGDAIQQGLSLYRPSGEKIWSVLKTGRVTQEVRNSIWEKDWSKTQPLSGNHLDLRKASEASGTNQWRINFMSFGNNWFLGGCSIKYPTVRTAWLDGVLFPLVTLAVGPWEQQSSKVMLGSVVFTEEESRPEATVSVEKKSKTSKEFN